MAIAHIRECSASKCGYNKNGVCHALAITVGGIGDHDCDTYCPSNSKGGIDSAIGSVGACKVTDCAFNSGLECSKPNIKIGMVKDTAVCTTYTAT